MPRNLPADQEALYRRLVSILAGSSSSLVLDVCGACLQEGCTSQDCQSALRCLRSQITRQINAEINAALDAPADTQSLIKLRSLFQALLEISHYEQDHESVLTGTSKPHKASA